VPATSNEAASEHEENIRENGSQHASLNDSDFAADERNDADLDPVSASQSNLQSLAMTYNELYSISKSCIH
jgi:hypothetical protein